MRILLLAGLIVLGLFGSAQAQNIAQKRPVTASSTEGVSYAENFAVDGDPQTRWSSTFTDNQYIIIDLTQTYQLSRVKLSWEDAYCSQYTLSTSNDNKAYTVVYTGLTSTLINDIPLTGASGRYLLVSCLQRATSYGMSLWEIEVNGAIDSPWSFGGYKCGFGNNPGEVRRNKNSNDAVLVWYCDTPTGIFPQKYCYGAGKEPNGIFEIAAAVIWSMLKGSVQRPCTVPEQALATQIITDVSPAHKNVWITVAANGTAVDRPVYTRNPNNTLGKVVPGVRAIVDTPNSRSFCNYERLQDSTGKGTNYFAVPIITADGVRHTDYYTVCKVTGIVSK